MSKGLKKIYRRRLELAYRAADRAKTVRELYFFVECIKEMKAKLEEV